MRHLAIARAYLDGADPVILGNVDREIRRRKKIVAFGRNVHRGQCDDEVGLAELPAFGEAAASVHRGLPRGAPASTHSRSCRSAIGQPRIVLERSVRRIRKPRRHLPVCTFCLIERAHGRTSS
jgi:hypothetical protein